MKFDYSKNFRYLHFRLGRIYTNYIIDALKTFNFTPGELEVLTFLNNNSPKFNTASHLIKYKGVSKALVSKSVNSLIDRGLIRSIPNEDDRRIMNLYINKQADYIVRKINEANEKFRLLIFKNISEEDLVIFHQVSRTMLENSKELE